jgi:hypothetical protein
MNIAGAHRRGHCNALAFGVSVCVVGHETILNRNGSDVDPTPVLEGY